ncbi:MAG: hypothetical protein K5739_01785 [Lachnospiraceae bacterium]|nr:hypothetical protein [Lachnospiraceae bacterium]
MKEQYGFTKEEAKLLADAYTKFSDKYSKKSRKKQINLFFSNLASLYNGYSGDDKSFKMMGDNPATDKALKFWEKLGVDAEKLKDVIENQHSACGAEGNRDFAHECAIYSVMANSNLTKVASSMLDNVNALVSYKGDIYSGSMGDDDIRSDIAASNIYYRMLKSKNGSIWEAMNNYNKGVADGTINESEEFLSRYGKGDTAKGMIKLEKEMNHESIATSELSKDVDSDKIKDCKERFIEHLKNELGD